MKIKQTCQNNGVTLGRQDSALLSNSSLWVQGCLELPMGINAEPGLPGQVFSAYRSHHLGGPWSQHWDGYPWIWSYPTFVVGGGTRIRDSLSCWKRFSCTPIYHQTHLNKGKEQKNWSFAPLPKSAIRMHSSWRLDTENVPLTLNSIHFIIEVVG